MIQNSFCVINRTIIYKEYSRLCEEKDIPYYPIRLVNDKSQLLNYIKLANAESNITFVGRLATYRYLDMHVTIEEALNAAEHFLKVSNQGGLMPAFCVDSF